MSVGTLHHSGDPHRSLDTSACYNITPPIAECGSPLRPTPRQVGRLLLIPLRPATSQHLDHLIPRRAVLKLEARGELVELVERHALHRLDKVVAHRVGDPGIECPAVEVLLELPEAVRSQRGRKGKQEQENWEKDGWNNRG